MESKTPGEQSEPGPEKTASGEPQVNAEQAEQQTNELRFVCGLGASAGGLAALLELFASLPFDNMTFVVLQHLAPDHPSLLPELLRRATKVAVFEAKDGDELRSNTVYVTPPKSEVAILGGKLRVWPLDMAARTHHPIDYFFQSLADDQGRRSVGVVLSGTGSDGSIGLRAIRAAGGLTFAQDPQTAKFAAMPLSAQRAGADFVFSPEKIAQELHTIGKSGGMLRRTHQVVQKEAELAKLVVLLRNHCRVDLTDYKFSMLERRIERRLAINKLDGLPAYLELVQRDGHELQSLADDVLINVTRFFRGKELYTALRENVFPAILRSVPKDEAVRLWSIGCSTGQEPYSLAICLLEAMEATDIRRKVQIFATDIDDKALAFARQGRYPQGVRAELTESVVERFFWSKGDELHIKREVRDTVIFSRQNVLRDPPFRGLHFASCRNLLIYLQSTAQRRVLSVLHYALRQQAAMALGEAESVGDAPELFSLTDRHARLYERSLDQHRVHAPLTNFSLHGPAMRRNASLPTRAQARSVRELVDPQLLHAWCAPGAITDEQLQVLEFRGDTARYLSLNAGGASLNLLRLTPTVLHALLRGAIAKLGDEGTQLTTSCLLEGELRLVTVRILPIVDLEKKRRYFYIGFSDGPMPTFHDKEEDSARDQISALSAHGAYSQTLERELVSTKESLSHAMEAQEVAVEELKNFSEEAQSANEELQSANEELETSKEEVQSANEELVVVNEELQVRMEELSTMQDELFHLLLQVDVPVLTVGGDLRLRRYSLASASLFDISSIDVGRPVDYINRFFVGINVRAMVQEALQKSRVQQLKVQHVNGTSYEVSVTSFGSVRRPSSGCLLLLRPLSPVTSVRRQLPRISHHADQRWRSDEQPMLICSARLRGIWGNDALWSRFSLTRDELVGQRLDRGPLSERLGDAWRRYLTALRKGKISLDAVRQLKSSAADAEGTDWAVRTRSVTEAGHTFYRVIFQEQDRG